ncbi:MAG: cysteine desulfurase CsdA [Flavobacteriales bacterium]|nr:MAG: cysteine desulfurase CsdA [Flavobacteriales bacterium]
MIDINHIRAQFPILDREVYRKPLVYFDNGATVQKPQSVIDSFEGYYRHYNANVHRGVHTLSNEATDAMEQSRKAFQTFLNASHDHEIIFTRGTTESINLVAHGFAQLLQEGDEVIISQMEHHSNIVPWQLACERSGAVLKVIDMDSRGVLDLEHFDSLLSERTKMVALVHVSNTLGTINPVKTIIDKAHQYGAAVLIDGAQAVAHAPVDVQALDCDFYALSLHKMYGPTGVGILYGKETWLDRLPPYQSGGEMIKTVRFDQTTYADLPFKFEAGTPHIAGNIASKQAIDFINEIGLDAIARYENELLDYATEKLSDIKGLKIIGTAPEKSAVISFVVEGLHPYDIGSILDKYGIAVRTGHHCTQPLMQFYDIPGTVRLSFAVYNTKAEIDVFTTHLQKTLQMLS